MPQSGKLQKKAATWLCFWPKFDRFLNGILVVFLRNSPRPTSLRPPQVVLVGGRPVEPEALRLRLAAMAAFGVTATRRGDNCQLPYALFA